MKKKIAFGQTDFDELAELVNLEICIDDQAFDGWLNYDYQLQPEEEAFLQQLVYKNRLFIVDYSEEELKAKLIIPILNKVDFNINGIHDWYERNLSAVIKDTLLYGRTDYMIASGFGKPKQPYFFIQEFKAALGNSHPRNALVAELLVALTLTKSNFMRGAYIVGANWNFVILKKTGVDKYVYLESPGYHILTSLKDIYIALQAVKYFIMNP